MFHHPSSSSSMASPHRAIAISMGRCHAQHAKEMNSFNKFSRNFLCMSFGRTLGSAAIRMNRLRFLILHFCHPAIWLLLIVHARFSSIFFWTHWKNRIDENRRRTRTALFARNRHRSHTNNIFPITNHIGSLLKGDAYRAHYRRCVPKCDHLCVIDPIYNMVSRVDCGRKYPREFWSWSECKTVLDWRQKSTRTFVISNRNHRNSCRKPKAIKTIERNQWIVTCQHFS